MAKIKAISTFTPPYLLTNAKLAETMQVPDIEKIAKGVGVKQRYVAEKGETASDLAFKAASRLFDEEGIDRATIDFIIFATQTPDYFLPATACTLQHRLGIPTTAGAFDFDLGCSGYTYGLAIADSFVESGLASNVLLLTGDTISKYLHKDDKNRILFGDSATATLVSADGIATIGKSSYGSDGSGADKLIMKSRACRSLTPTGNEEEDSEGNIRRDDFFYMSGESIFNFTIDRVPKLIEETLRVNGLKRDDIDYYVFHQANKFMLNTLRKVCGIDKDKFYINLENTGNTTSSTVPIGLKDSLDNGKITPGMNVMVAGFGVGLSWAATVLKF